MHTPVSILCQVKMPALDNQARARKEQIIVAIIMTAAYYSVFKAYYAAIPVRPYYSHFYASILASCLATLQLWKIIILVLGLIYNYYTINLTCVTIMSIKKLM